MNLHLDIPHQPGFIYWVDGVNQYGERVGRTFPIPKRAPLYFWLGAEADAWHYVDSIRPAAGVIIT